MSTAADLLFEAIGRGLSAVATAAEPDLPELLRESEGRRLALVVRGSERFLEVEVRNGALRVLPPRRLTGDRYPTGAVGEATEIGPPAAAASSGADRSPDEAVPSPVDGADAPDPSPGDPREVLAGGSDGPAEPAQGADLVLAGSVPDFVRFLLSIRRDPLASPSEAPFGALEVHGSAAARNGFVDLLRRIDPDYEALLARAAGGVVAHAVARTTVGRLFQARRTAVRLVDDLAEYLEEETRLVPDSVARTRFAGGVEALRDKVAELEGRLDRARRRD